MHDFVTAGGMADIEQSAPISAITNQRDDVDIDRDRATHSGGSRSNRIQLHAQLKRRDRSQIG
jgi:hypothetical protein